MVRLSFKEIVYLLKWIGFFDPYTQKKTMYMFYEKNITQNTSLHIHITYTHNFQKT